MPDHRHDRRDRPPEKSLDELWPEYLKHGYFDEHCGLKTEFACRTRIEPLAKGLRDAKPSLTSTQLRRFFNHCRAIERKLREAPADQTIVWSQQLAQVCKLDSGAADALAKGKVPRLFHDFIHRNVAYVTSDDKRSESQELFLCGFLPHFEALVGFAAQFLKKN